MLKCKIIVAYEEGNVKSPYQAISSIGVTERGNFERKNILHRVRDTEVLAEMHHLSAEGSGAEIGYRAAKTIRGS